MLNEEDEEVWCS